MTRLAIRINIQEYLAEDLTQASRALKLSKSEIVNRALASAAADFPTLCKALLSTDQGRKGVTKLASFMMDPEVLDTCQIVMDKLHISKDGLIRLALDYYFLKLKE